MVTLGRLAVARRCVQYGRFLRGPLGRKKLGTLDYPNQPITNGDQRIEHGGCVQGGTEYGKRESAERVSADDVCVRESMVAYFGDDFGID